MTAKVTMILYGDLECPICRAFVLGSGFSQLFARDVRSGKVRIVYRSFCTATCNGPGMAVFVRQQVAAYAAGEQHRFWQYAMLFLRNQGAEDSDYVNARFLDRIAGLVPGLDEAAWERARQDRDLVRKVDSDEAAANRAGIVATSTIVFNGPRGKTQVSSGTPDYEALARAVRSVS